MSSNERNEDEDETFSSVFTATDETNCEDESPPIPNWKFHQNTTAISTTNTDTTSTDTDTTTNMNMNMNLEPNQLSEYEKEIEYIEKLSPTHYRINIGFVPNMKVPADIIVNHELEKLLLLELQESILAKSTIPNYNTSNNNSNNTSNNKSTDKSTDKKSKKKKPSNPSFIPALKQMANVAALPGIIRCLAMPDAHSGYGFCIGNVVAFDMNNPEAIISPGGVGFDINCGVRLIRTNIVEEQVMGLKREELVQTLFNHLPVGVGTEGVIPATTNDINDILKNGIDWAIEHNYAWKEDKEHCEENGVMETANPDKVSSRAKKRGLNQLGTLGGGNHYAEVQVIDEIYDDHAASVMGISTVGQICIMIHTGSRGLGHQVATDALQTMEKAMSRDKIQLNDRQLSCARIQSQEGQDYFQAMSAAANYAWVNRSCVTYLIRQAFEKVFEQSAEEMDMHLVYDVCHNVAKIETHIVDDDGQEQEQEQEQEHGGQEKEDGQNGKSETKNYTTKSLLVHRKGSTRAFPPHHPSIPTNYQEIGQPALIGGTMGTCSYVLLGTDNGMQHTFGSTCHGAGRALSRNQSRKRLDHKDVLQQLKDKNIAIRVSNKKLVTEEAPESYKDVSNVVDTCHEAGISRKVVKLRPIAVVKG